MTFTYQYQIHVSDNKIGDQYNVLLYYYLTFILKKLRTKIRTFEAQITKKIRTSSLGEKKGVLIKKKRCRTSPPSPKGIENLKLYHYKDNSETRADGQNASYV